ncbi:MAG: 50S ribosomal protein L25 [Bryobacterales bacterium]|nr:50S ribosomal protein L25 [Bryobacterales bacterium]
MRKDITVAATPRSTRGKNEARRLRVESLSPAVVYGAGKDPVAVAVSPKELNRILHSSSGHNTIFNLDIQGVENTPVMIVDWQRDPIKSNLLHADLLRIDLSKRIRVKVPVHLHGDPVGVKTFGGHLEVVNREIAIECLPDDIPEAFNEDIAALNIGQGIRAGDVKLSGSMVLTEDPQLVIAHVVGAKAEAAETAEAGATAEPEVIKKGKKEAEGEAEAKPKKK